MKILRRIFRLRPLLVVFMAAVLFAGCAPSAHPPVVLMDHPPPVSEMVRSHGKGRLEFIERHDAPAVPVRVFGDSGTGVPVIMVHGLQSHSGWFTQSADFIASLGMPVYAFDRSGSGLSAATRGDCESFREWVDELGVVWESAARRHGWSRVHLVGHCFGAIPAAAFACERPGEIASLVLSTPGIYTRKGVYFRDMARIGGAMLTGRQVYIPVRLQPGMFTDLPEYESFIAGDNLALSLATARFYREIPRARRFVARHADRLKMPVFMALAQKDPICDNNANRRFFENLPSKTKTLKSYADAEHVLEFSRERDAFFNDLAAWFDSMNDESAGK